MRVALFVLLFSSFGCLSLSWFIPSCSLCCQATDNSSKCISNSNTLQSTQSELCQSWFLSGLPETQPRCANGLLPRHMVRMIAHTENKPVCDDGSTPKLYDEMIQKGEPLPWTDDSCGQSCILDNGICKRMRMEGLPDVQGENGDAIGGKMEKKEEQNDEKKEDIIGEEEENVIGEDKLFPTTEGPQDRDSIDVSDNLSILEPSEERKKSTLRFRQKKLQPAGGSYYKILPAGGAETSKNNEKSKQERWALKSAALQIMTTGVQIMTKAIKVMSRIDSDDKNNSEIALLDHELSSLNEESAKALKNSISQASSTIGADETEVPATDSANTESVTTSATNKVDDSNPIASAENEVAGSGEGEGPNSSGTEI